MTAQELRDYFVEQHFIMNTQWVTKETTVDQIIVGRADKEVKRVMVTWQISLDTLNKAISEGYDAIVTHEATFWSHRDEMPYVNGDRIPKLKYDTAQEKLRLIKENDITIIRNHDVWDTFPEFGIPSSWGKFLQLNYPPVNTGDNGYLHRYDIKECTLEDFAKVVSKQCMTLGESKIEVFGDPKTMVSKIGIGTGCVCSITEFIEMGCDCSIVTDDGSSYWEHISWAIDINHPVIRVNHGTSEKPGLRSLEQYINKHINGVKADFYLSPLESYYVDINS